jgi:hypothetical protein
MRFLRTWWPTTAAVIVLWITVAVCTLLSLRANQGHFVYALDDAYIHMAIAKNFSTSGTWATSGNAFSSDSSSPLWTGLLTVCYLVIGANEIAPFILNICFATLLLILCSRVLRRAQISGIAEFVCLLCLIYAIPLPTVISVGMEHTLHICLTILFCFCVSLVLSNGIDAGIYRKIMYPLASAVVLCRYEGLFLVAVTSALFALKKRFGYAILLATFGVIPVVAYGILSLHYGSDFLPNAISLKGHFPNSLAVGPIFEFVYEGLRRVCTGHMLVLVAASLALFVIQRPPENNPWNKERILIAIFVPTALLHSLFANIGWFFRYEAYLVALGTLVIFVSGTTCLRTKAIPAVSVKDGPRFVAFVALVVILSSPLVLRAEAALQRIPAATHNIYVQQYQVAQFLKKYYAGQSVAVNDLGAISFYGDVKCVDLWGVGNVEVARFRQNIRTSGRYERQLIEDLLKRNEVHIAVIYKHHIPELNPITARWQEVGQWRMLAERVSIARDVVSFFALDDSAKAPLLRNLTDFGPFLPKDVEQKGLYVEHRGELINKE